MEKNLLRNHIILDMILKKFSPVTKLRSGNIDPMLITSNKADKKQIKKKSKKFFDNLIFYNKIKIFKRFHFK